MMYRWHVDDMCVMFMKGDYTVVASDPEYVTLENHKTGTQETMRKDFASQGVLRYEEVNE